MKLLEEFAEWLKQWYREGEVSAMLRQPWNVDVGVKVKGQHFIGIEEFLWHAATFIVEKTLHSYGVANVEYVIRLNEVYAFDRKTRTVVIAARYRGERVNPETLNAFLEDMARQAEEAKGYMSIRVVVA